MNRFSYLVLALVAALLMVSCGQDKVEQLEQEKMALEAERAYQDSLLNAFMTAFNTFEDNLALIKEKENLISFNTTEGGEATDSKDRIIEDIQQINDLLDQNRILIDELSAKINEAEGLNSQYRRSIASLEKQLASRTADVAQLKEQLAQKDFKIDDLNGRMVVMTTRNDELQTLADNQGVTIEQQNDSLSQQARVMDRQDEKLHTAYFVTGSSKELKDQHVITKEGGFIGIGKTKQLASDFNEEAFQTIDIREITRIPVASKKAELLTVHPSGTYEFKDIDDDKQYDLLEIKDPALFWKSSRYLVVMTN